MPPRPTQTGSHQDQSAFEALLNREVQIISAEGRVFVGELVSLDHTLNAVLQNCRERRVGKEGLEETSLGLYFLRGELVAVIGEFDPEAEQTVDYKKACPIPPLVV